MILRELGEHGLASLRDAQLHRATIFRAAIANDEPRFDETIYELDNRVMPNAQLRCERAD